MVLFSEFFKKNSTIYYLIFKINNNENLWIIDFSNNVNQLYERIKDYNNSDDCYKIFSLKINSEREIKFQQFFLLKEWDNCIYTTPI